MAWGWLDRLGKIASAAGGAGGDAVGFYKDVASATFSHDDFNDFVGQVSESVKSRGASFLGNTVTPEGAIGSVIGGLPEELVRKPVRKLMEWSDDVYDEASRATSVATTAASLARPGGRTPFLNDEQQGYANWLTRSNPATATAELLAGAPKLLKKQTWVDAQNLSRGYSPGQSMALAVVGTDRTDPAEVQKWEGSHFYDFYSAGNDALMRTYVDPLIVGGKVKGAIRGTMVLKDAATGARTIVPKVVASQEHINAAANSTRWLKANEEMEGKSTSYIQQRFFADQGGNGVTMAHLFANASDAEERTLLMRTFLGDTESLNKLNEKSAFLSNALDKALGKQTLLRDLDDGGDELMNTPEELARIQKEIDELNPQFDRAKREREMWGATRTVPTATRGGKLRTEITRSETYQKNLLATPVQVLFQMNPQRLVNLEEESSWIQVKRMLDQSDLEQARKDEILAEYASHTTSADRQNTLIRAEEEAVSSIAKTANMSKDDLQKVLDRAKLGRDTAVRHLKSRAYDGAGRSRVEFYDGEDFRKIELPLSVSQNANILPLADMRKVRRASTRIGEIVANNPAATIPTELLTSYYKIWRPFTLLRLGWPQRVLADEQMRILATIGAVAQLGNLGSVAAASGRAVRTGLTDLFPQGLRSVPAALDDARTIAEEGVKGRVTEAVAKSLRSYDFGKQDIRVGRYPVPGAFASPGDDDNILYSLVSSRGAWQKIAGQTENGIFSHLANPADPNDIKLPSGRMYLGQWGHIEPESQDWGAAWEHAVNFQIGQDQLGKLRLMGKSVDDAVNWLRSTKGGREYARQLDPFRRKDLEDSVSHYFEQIDVYTAQDSRIAKLALEGNAKLKDIEAVIPDVSSRFNVHGQLLADLQGKSESVRLLKRVTDGLWSSLGQWPTDLLSRQPFFKTMYENEVRRLINLADNPTGDALDAETISTIVKNARKYALDENKKLLYDLADESRFAEMLKFVSPFYMAWQEVITRWAGITIERPQSLAIASQIWRSPERGGLVYDQNGYQVNADGSGTNPLTGERIPSELMGRERHIRFMLPDYVTKKIPALKTMEQVTLNKKSFNLLMSGGPGAGPPVAVAVNEIAKDRPQIADSVKWALPFGPQQDTIELLKPTLLKRWEATQEEDNQRFANSVYAIYMNKLVKYRQSVGGPDELPEPSWNDAVKEAQGIENVRFWSQLTLPVAPQFRSPYQMYIDSYRRANERYGQWQQTGKDSGEPAPFGVDANGDAIAPDVWFYDTYGEEFFALTTSLSKSNNGVAPTVEAWKLSKKRKDLIEEFPELGSFIIGEEGRASFSQAVYRMQADTPLAPGSNLNERGPRGREGSNDPDVRQGWIEFSRAMDLIEAERIDRKLPSLNVKAASDLKRVKQNVVRNLAKKHEAWWLDYSQTDAAAMYKRIEGMRKISTHPTYGDDPSMAGVRKYIEGRDSILAELKSRKEAGKSASLEAQSNRDVARVWSNYVSKLIQENPAFSNTYYRWLDNDRVELEVVN